VPGWHAPAVDIGRFWDIIEAARASAGRDRPFHDALTDHLATLTDQEILEYHERFEKIHARPSRRRSSCSRQYHEAH